MFHPQVFGIHPIWKESSPFDFRMEIVLDNYKISLHRMWVKADCAMPVINGISPQYFAEGLKEGVIYDKLDIPILYTGAILLAHTKLNDYGIRPEAEEGLPCFCYKSVYEYIFENGILITTIDHSRSMLRIRKNIDFGYRDWNKKRDQRCIERFMKTSFVGDYKKVSKKKTDEYLCEMRKLYKDSPCIMVEMNNL